MTRCFIDYGGAQSQTIFWSNAYLMNRQCSGKSRCNISFSRLCYLNVHMSCIQLENPDLTPYREVGLSLKINWEHLKKIWSPFIHFLKQHANWFFFKHLVLSLLNIKIYIYIKSAIYIQNLDLYTNASNKSIWNRKPWEQTEWEVFNLPGGGGGKEREVDLIRLLLSLESAQNQSNQKIIV